MSYRPTSSMLKMALFNILGDIEGLMFLELFAGSGTISLEAKNRGAKPVAVDISSKNLKTKDIKFIKKDALAFLKTTKEQFDIVFADPPYKFADYDKLLFLVKNVLSEGGLFILEHSSKLDFGSKDKRIYGDSAISFWYKEEL
ncbi:MAG: RsmD family RNA methyltransferase [Hydrogenobaculum sp.]